MITSAVSVMNRQEVEEMLVRTRLELNAAKHEICSEVDNRLIDACDNLLNLVEWLVKEKP